MHRGLRIGSASLDSNTFNLMKSGSYEGKIAGLYDLEETLGRGHFAVVKLARHVFTGEKVAVKVIDKSKLDEISKAHLFQEVRCMKLVQHPNVVRLYEVIDTATKLYLILELGDGGDLYDYIMRHDTGLSEQLAKEYFRQIVRAISYCHQLHVVHRDLKPENVVFFEKLGVVKLTDFGFSNKFCPGQKLETSCGSLAYSAPEILLGDSYDAPAVDVWSLGVILYMLVCGQAPFQEANDSETLTMIMDCKYIVPPHVSKECRDLIARMLVRNPEKRATLTEIANHPWLTVGKQENFPNDVIPLVSKEQLSEEDHNFIVQKIVNGNIATKDEIQECLDKNEYNHITATYYLLAERKLRSKRQDQTIKHKRPEHLSVTYTPTSKRENNGTGPSPCLLTVPRTPGDVPQRTRKCSIVQEDEEEEDISNSISSREELAPPLNRRGSRSEGRLNLALQERIAESERRKPEKIEQPQLLSNKLKLDEKPLIVTKKMEKSPSLCESLTKKDNLITTTVITDSSTITIPIVTNSPLPCSAIPKYKTMPSPTRNLLINNSPSPLQLNEIFEEGDPDPSKQQRQFVSRTQHRTSYEQRRSKFHKARTASCSSSDASDDDSEKRKKRAHKLNNTSTKPLQGRRDSHDDSSDSQEPGTGGSSGAGVTGNNTFITSNNNTQVNTQQQQQQQQKSGSGNNSSGGRQKTNGTVLLGRRHKATHRRNGETRLRESQSLNRITEVQEDGLVISTNIDVQQKNKSIGARLLQGFNTIKSKNNNSEKQQQEEKVITHISRKDTITTFDEKENLNKLLTIDKGSLKKMRLLGKYFQVPKKLCIPLPGIFNKNRLYKAQSCSSLNRDKIINSKTRQRAISVVRNSEGDINQNKDKHRNSTVVQLNNVCNELTGICAIHLGQASKCCSSFC